MTIDQHPLIQKWEQDGRLQQSALFAFGTEPGWFGIIDRLLIDLFNLGWDGQVAQVKEKFGGLRFYIGDGSHEIFDRIRQAEKESYKTCEVCGKAGKTTNQDNAWWIKTLCEEHAKRYLAGEKTWEME